MAQNPENVGLIGIKPGMQKSVQNHPKHKMEH
jgi:hypothetical protein